MVFYMYYIWIKYCIFRPGLLYSPYSDFLLAMGFFCELSKLTPILQKMSGAIARAQRKALDSVCPVPFGFGFLCFLTGHFEHGYIFGSAVQNVTGPAGSCSVLFHG